MLPQLTLAALVFSAFALLPAAAPPPPAAAPGPDGRFDIDASHTSVLFRIKHLDVASFWGRFNKVGGKLLLDEADPAESLVTFTIEAASIDTNHADRDTHLRGPDFFDVEEHGTLSFESTKVVPGKEGALEVTGDLTVHGKTKSITFTAQRTGYGENLGVAGTRVGYETRFTIQRSDFGMDYRPDALSDAVELIVAIEAAKAK